MLAVVTNRSAAPPKYLLPKRAFLKLLGILLCLKVAAIMPALLAFALLAGNIDAEPCSCKKSASGLVSRASEGTSSLGDQCVLSLSCESWPTPTLPKIFDDHLKPRWGACSAPSYTPSWDATLLAQGWELNRATGRSKPRGHL